MSEQSSELFQASELLRKLFDEALVDSNQFDQEIVQITRLHLDSASIHSKAGSNLAKDLLDIAEKRATGGES